ncbi:MAG: hypothetical protein P8R54_22115 [Myxococcota bacterium]|nr:hypothetical protein [Myxococcota bacterium]
MRRLILTGSAFLLLACAGLSEKLIESVTGEQIDISEDGMAMTLPGGGRMEMKFGDGAVHDPALSLSPPPRSTLIMSALISLPEQPVSHMVSYQSEDEASGLIEQYRAEITAKGLEPEQSVGSEGAAVLNAAEGELTYFVSVGPPSEGNVGSAVTLGIGSRAAIEEGLSNRL